jgi:hypothetical protein
MAAHRSSGSGAGDQPIRDRAGPMHRTADRQRTRDEPPSGSTTRARAQSRRSFPRIRQVRSGCPSASRRSTTSRTSATPRPTPVGVYARAGDYIDPSSAGSSAAARRAAAPSGRAPRPATGGDHLIAWAVRRAPACRGRASARSCKPWRSGVRVAARRARSRSMPCLSASASTRSGHSGRSRRGRSCTQRPAAGSRITA